MVLRNIIIILSVLMISACSSNVYNIKNNHSLKTGNAVFLTKLQTNYPIQLALRNSSGETFQLKTTPVNNKDDLLVVSLPSGKYSLDEISWKDGSKSFSNNDSLVFKLKNGKVNYICDLGAYFNLKGSNGSKPDLNFVLPVYSKRLTHNEFKKTYPKISKKLAFISSPISKCVTGKSKEAKKLSQLLK